MLNSVTHKIYTENFKLVSFLRSSRVVTWLWMFRLSIKNGKVSNVYRHRLLHILQKKIFIWISKFIPEKPFFMSKHCEWSQVSFQSKASFYSHMGNQNNAISRKLSIFSMFLIEQKKINQRIARIFHMWTNIHQSV